MRSQKRKVGRRRRFRGSERSTAGAEEQEQPPTRRLQATATFLPSVSSVLIERQELLRRQDLERQTREEKEERDNVNQRTRKACVNLKPRSCL